MDYLQKGGKPDQLKSAGIRPNLMKRGAGTFWSTTDAIPSHGTSHPSSTTGRRRWKSSTDSMTWSFTICRPTRSRCTIWRQTGRRRELLLTMNEKLNRLIDAEVGEDRGQMLPGGIDAGWDVTAETMAGA
ncbi:hypothetical protein ACU4GD_36600 [Cupriavidus basilensis]